MNKFFKIAIILFVIITCSNSLFSQQRRYSQSISANPIGLAFGVLNATYEQKLDPVNTFTINGYYWAITDWNAFGIGGSYRWYLKIIDDNKHIIEGLSVGPLVAIGFWSWKGSSLYKDYGGVSFAIGGELAYKWIFDGFVVEPMINLTFNVNKIEGLSTYNPFSAGINLGYAW